VEAAEQLEGLEDRHLLLELRFLKLDAQALAQRPIGAPGPALAEDPHLAGVRAVQALEDLDRGGLARTIRAQQAEALTAPDLEIDAVHGDDVGVALDQPAHLDGEIDAGRGSRDGGHGAVTIERVVPVMQTVARPRVTRTGETRRTLDAPGTAFDRMAGCAKTTGGGMGVLH